MNWDWEKLQQQRQRQSGQKPSDNGGGRPPRPPFRKIDFGQYKSKFNSGLPIGPLVAVAVLLWLVTGIFIIRPGEIGVVQRFGEFNRTVEEGPHYRIPFPFESHTKVEVQILRTVVLGQSQESSKYASQVALEESSMFTGDENIVHMQFNVQYDLGSMETAHVNAVKYLFNVERPDAMVAIAAEAAMREVVGSNTIDDILTSQRAGVELRAKEVLQTILDNYESGVRIRAVQLLDVQPPVEVAGAFKDVASAREDRVRIINQAEAYRNEIVPVANGTARSMINAADAYSRQVVLGAEGEAQKFTLMLDEFNKAQGITKKRMHLDAMSDILSSSGIDKIIVTKDATGSILPFMNVDRSPGSSKVAPVGIEAGRDVK